MTVPTTALLADDIPAPEPGHATRHRLNGLDGFRAFAVVLVMLYHFNVPGFIGGWIGPQLFFVLSGFLITTLLIDRSGERPGRIDLLDFWIRRLRRLYPALLLLVAALVALVAFMDALGDTVASGVVPGSLRSESFASLGYFANWHLIEQHVNYFGQSTSLLKHTWSLAIEEQFYVIFPLVFLLVGLTGRYWRRVGLGFAAVGVGVSALLAALGSGNESLNAVYYSTQTNAYHLLVGVALAFGLHGWSPSARVQRLLGWMSLPTFAVLVGFTQLTSTPDGSPRLWMFTGGGVLLDVTAALLITTLVYGSPDGWISRLFNVRAVVWLGAVSYGVYLWHYPFAVLLTPVNTHLPRAGLVVVQITATLLMTTLSFYLVERVVRETAITPRSLRWAVYGSSVAVVLVLVALTPRILAGVR